MSTYACNPELYADTLVDLTLQMTCEEWMAFGLALASSGNPRLQGAAHQIYKQLQVTRVLVLRPD